MITWNRLHSLNHFLRLQQRPFPTLYHRPNSIQFSPRLCCFVLITFDLRSVNRHVNPHDSCYCFSNEPYAHITFILPRYNCVVTFQISVHSYPHHQPLPAPLLIRLYPFLSTSSSTGLIVCATASSRLFYCHASYVQNSSLYLVLHLPIVELHPFPSLTRGLSALSGHFIKSSIDVNAFGLGWPSVRHHFHPGSWRASNITTSNDKNDNNKRMMIILLMAIMMMTDVVNTYGNSSTNDNVHNNGIHFTKITRK